MPQYQLIVVYKAVATDDWDFPRLYRSGWWMTSHYAPPTEGDDSVHLPYNRAGITPTARRVHELGGRVVRPCSVTV